MRVSFGIHNYSLEDRQREDPADATSESTIDAPASKVLQTS